jgi:hypothetical protein
MELNPNHPTTSTMHDHWHKIALLLVARLPGKQTVITLQEIEAVGDGQQAITIKDVGIGLELRVVSMDEGRKLAKQEGGLPI